MSDISVSKNSENKQLIITFSIKAPLESVWNAYSKKSRFEAWWGPQGWKTTTSEFSFAPGGKIHYGMKCEDESQGEWYGQISWGVMKIENVENEQQFSYRDYFSDEAGELNTSLPALLVQNTFAHDQGSTTVTCTSNADTMEQIEELIAMGMVEGFTSQIERLKQLLEK